MEKRYSALACLQLRNTSPCWSPGVWSDTHGTRKETVNLYAPLTLRFGLTHGRPCTQVWSGGRLAGPTPVRSDDAGHVCRTHALRSVYTRSGPAWTCIEDLRVRTNSVTARSARPPRSYTALAPSEVGVPPQERRGLCLSCVKRLTQGCGSTLEKSKTRLRLFSPANTPMER